MTDPATIAAELQQWQGAHRQYRRRPNAEDRKRLDRRRDELLILARGAGMKNSQIARCPQPPDLRRHHPAGHLVDPDRRNPTPPRRR